MTSAVISIAIVIDVLIVAVVGLFWLEEPVAGWTALVVAIIGVFSLLGMVVSSAAARRA